MLSIPFDSIDFLNRIRGKHKSRIVQVGKALLNPRIIAGCGNIYKSESLYKAKVNPFKTVDQLSDDEIKKVYRQKCVEFHPDKLASKGLPDEFMKYAHEQLTKINEAYETIKKVRG